MTRLIYKILSAAQWRDAERAGVFRGAAVDLDDGFIHFSTEDQMRDTAALHFAGCHDLVLVAVDAEKRGDALKWEVSRGGALFPHLYGNLATRDALWVKPLPQGPDGKHVFPSLSTSRES